MDTQEDYNLLCIVFDYLYEKNPLFNHKDIIKLFENKKWLYNINKDINQKVPCVTVEEELKEAIRLTNIQNLHNVEKILKKVLNDK